MKPSLSPPRRGGRLALAAAALLALGAQAQAQVLLQPGPRSDRSEADTLEWRAGLQWQHDDNVFLSPQAQSDQIQVATLGLNLNKAWSLQRLEFDAHLDDHRYDRYSQLDFTALNYQGAFRWATSLPCRRGVKAQRNAPW